MPEIKNNFIQGKMNKDLDERLLPNGQYRHALNVEISTSEDNSVGTLQNILGNKRLDDFDLTGFKCVGTIADEKTNKLYWMLSSYAKDAIIEYNVEQDIVTPVLVDLNASNTEAVLKFAGNTITGINIINNLLYWTDNNSEPKKINIDDCKEGTKDFNTHTQLIFEEGSFWGLTCKHVHSGVVNNLVDNPFNENGGRFVWFEKKQMDTMLQGETHVAHLYDAGLPTGESPESIETHWFIRHYRDNEFLGVKKIKVYTEDTASRIFSGNPSYGNYFRTEPYGDSDRYEYKKGDVIFGHGKAAGGGGSTSGIDNPDGITIPIQEKHITVIKQKPLKALGVKVNYKREENALYSKPNLFEEDFPRFSYRYKYRDNEFSAFAPFTDPVFNPQYVKNEKESDASNVYYDKDNFYDIKEPFNKAMQNSIHSVELLDFVDAQIPEDVVEIEILYKKEDSPVIYSINSIKRTDSAWHETSYHEGHEIGFDQGLGASSMNQNTVTTSGSSFIPKVSILQTDGGLLKGIYKVTSENIYAALPANQLLRPYDNVPRRALSQEVTGNRIVYGNYLQNYNLGSYSPKVKIQSVLRNVSSEDTYTRNSNYADVTGNENKSAGEVIHLPQYLQNNYLSNEVYGGLPSIKSQRNYQAGVVYCDKYGRETPVFTSDESGIFIPWQDEEGKHYASKVSQLEVSTLTKFPPWVDHVKFFIKQSSNDYYNLVMSRAWLNKRTYDLDNSEGHLWISFPSSDRNKIQEGDYIILKKLIGVGEEQVDTENKFKILDIADEAPDAVKFRMANLGAVSNKGNILDEQVSNAAGNQFFMNSGKRIDKQTDTLIINWKTWTGSAAGFNINLAETADSNNIDLATTAKHLFFSWSIINNNGRRRSTRYRVTGITPKGTGDFIVKLAQKIKKEDADLAHFNSDSDSSNSGLGLKTDLVFQIERKELKEFEDFSGSFFVKISKNTITSLIEVGEKVDISTHNFVVADHNVFWWKDDGATGSNPTTGVSSYGLTNYSGIGGYYASSNLKSIHHASNNEVGDVHVDNASNSLALKLTDYADAWEGILNRYGRGTFFIDSMHMVAGQANHSNYAKFCTVTWQGYDEKSAWSYQPPMMWITDYLKSNVEFARGSSVIAATDVYTEYRKLNQYNYFRRTTKDLAPNDNTYGATTIQQRIDGEGRPLSGWVGANQLGRRVWPTKNTTFTEIKKHHINGLEGIVNTKDLHTTGARKWLNGLNSSPRAFKFKRAGSPSNIYSPATNNNTGKTFMHLSFFAPGKDLIDQSKFPANFTLGGDNAIGKYLQGVWGGGVTTASRTSVALGTDTDKENRHHDVYWEHHVDSTGKWQDEAPGPGVGYGYDLNYKELHERQWDPTFNDLNDDDNAKIREFLSNLQPGSRFKFSTDTSSNPTIYTILNVNVKKLYNHTSWRETWNRVDADLNSVDAGYAYRGTGAFSIIDPNNLTGALSDIGFYEKHYAHRSVDHQALLWLETLDKEGKLDASASTVPETDLKQKLADFGAAHNRRVCYIVEIDKNPEDSGNYDPLTSGINAHRGQGDFATTSLIGHDRSGSDYGGADIQFVTPTQSVLLHELNKFPAIWETSPKKLDVNLDIYYEASDAIPVVLNEKTNELFAPLGCRVELVDSNIETPECYLKGWSGRKAYIEPGFPRGTFEGEIDYSEFNFKFIRKDGSYTIARCDAQQLIGVVDGFKTDFLFREDIGQNITAGLSWNNCYSFSNGIESNRIRDDFNEMMLTSGVKVSTRLQDTYEQERRSSGLIFSGIYNSNSGINDLNQFIMAERITKDLNPTYGSIQKLFQRRISLVAFCEDRVISITSNKDTIFNADGNPQLVASDKVLGDATPFVGEYGISKNPESFASESYRAYFTDKQRGAVLRLSKDGLTPISKSGMHDYFRDRLKNYSALIGTYDKYKEDYNLTLSFENDENLIVNQYFEEGAESIQLTGSLLNHVANHEPGGISLVYPWEEYNVDSFTTPFAFGVESSDTEDFISEITVTNHPFIPKGYFQQELPETSVSNPDTIISAATNLTFNTWAGENVHVYDVVNDTTNVLVAQSSPLPNSGIVIKNTFGPAVGSPLSNEYYPTSIIAGGAPFSGSGSINTRSRIIRHVQGTYISSTGLNQTSDNWISYSNGYTNNDGTGPNSFYPVLYGSQRLNDNPASGRKLATLMANNRRMLVWDRINTGDYYNNSSVNSNGVLGGSILPEDSHVVIAPRPAVNNQSQNAQIFSDPTFSPLSTSNDQAQVFHGDEVLVLVKFRVWQSSFDNPELGYNVIKPVVELVDGNNNTLNSNLLQIPDNTSTSPLYKEIAGSSPSVLGSIYPNNSSLTVTTAVWNAAQPGRLVSGAGGSGTQADGSGPVSSLTGNEWYDYGESLVGRMKQLHYVQDFSTNPVISAPTSHNGPYSNIQAGIDYTTFTQTEHFSASIDNAYQDLYVGGYFKFKDNNNTSLDSTSIAVQDLRIKIYQTQKGYPLGPISSTSSYSELNESGNYPPTDNSYRRGYQFWAVTEVLLIKTSGVVTNTTAAVTAPSPDTITQYAQPDIPSADVPAWVNIEHHGFKGWNAGDINGGVTAYGSVTNSLFPECFRFPATPYGLQPGKTTNTVQRIDQTASVAAQQLIYKPTPAIWYTPTNPTPGNQTSLPPHPHPDPLGGGTLGATTTIPSSKTVDYNNAYWQIQTNSQSARDLNFTMPNDTWQVGTYYLVDIEFDNSFNPNTGTGGNNGHVHVIGTLDVNATTSTFPNAHEIGILSGSSSNRGARLVQHNRQEYPFGSPDNKNVLRTIFLMSSDATVVTNSAYNDLFKLRFFEFQNTARITKVMLKKLDYLNATGSAHNWVNSEQDINGPHSFSRRQTYYQGGLCFDTTADPGNYKEYRQNFEDYVSSPPTMPRPQTTVGGWKFNFNVTNNPRTANVTGEFLIVINNAIGDSSISGECEGIIIEGIANPGSYSAYFNMDGSINATSFSTQAVNTNNFPPGQDWFVIDNATNSPATGITISQSPLLNDAQFANCILVRSNSNIDCAARFSSFELTDLTVVYTGGQSGAWQYNGFNTSTDDYIIWDDVIDQNTGLSNQRLTFNNMPMVDPFATGTPIELICASQYIDKTINRFEKYKISFYHQLTDGMVHFYYFNPNGYGFRIYDVGPTTGTPQNDGSYYVERVVEIGQEEFLNFNPIDASYAPEFKESLVIRMQGGQPSNIDVNGWIDDISMVKFREDNETQRTITYSEDVGGWTSFKSFIPENGVSISKSYFTFKNGELYRHYAPQKYNEQTTNWEDCELIHADNYNRFYANSTYQSRIKFIFNSEPSTVKSFNAISYEGTQARIKKPINSDNISDNQVQAWVLGGGNNGQAFEIDGWFCDSVITNLETGSVHEFVKKEGKWFNYIKGSSTLNNFGQNILNAKKASVQGIGVLLQAEETTYEGEEIQIEIQ